MRTNPFSARSGTRPPVAAAVAAAIAAALATISSPVHAFDFDLTRDLRGSWDTTFSYGARWRVEGRDGRIISTSAGGRGRSGGDAGRQRGLRRSFRRPHPRALNGHVRLGNPRHSS